MATALIGITTSTDIPIRHNATVDRQNSLPDITIMMPGKSLLDLDKTIRRLFSGGYDSVIIVDMDCELQRDLVKIHRKMLRGQEPTVTYFPIREKRRGSFIITKNIKPEFDRNKWKTVRNILNGNHLSISNFGINKSAFDLLSSVNEKMYGERALFPKPLASTSMDVTEKFLACEALLAGCRLEFPSVKTCGIVRSKLAIGDEKSDQEARYRLLKNSLGFLKKVLG